MINTDPFICFPLVIISIFRSLRLALTGLYYKMCIQATTLSVSLIKSSFLSRNYQNLRGRALHVITFDFDYYNELLIRALRGYYHFVFCIQYKSIILVPVSYLYRERVTVINYKTDFILSLFHLL